MRAPCAGVLKGLRGESITQCAYVESSITDAAYFASPCKFGPNGVEEVTARTAPSTAPHRRRPGGMGGRHGGRAE